MPLNIMSASLWKIVFSITALTWSRMHRLYFCYFLSCHFKFTIKPLGKIADPKSNRNYFEYRVPSSNNNMIQLAKYISKGAGVDCLP